MATLVAPDCSAGAPAKGLRVGSIQVASTFSVPSSMSSGDVIQMVKVPANAMVTYMAVYSDLAGQGSLVVGDGISANRYITETITSAGALPAYITTGFVPYTYSADDTIDITTSASTNFSAGAIYMIVHMTMDP